MICDRLRDWMIRHADPGGSWDDWGWRRWVVRAFGCRL